VWVSRMCGAALNLPEEKAFESTGVEPVFPEKNQAIDYAQNRACFRSGEIRVLNSSGKPQRTITFSEADPKAVIAPKKVGRSPRIPPEPGDRPKRCQAFHFPFPNSGALISAIYETLLSGKSDSSNF